ncbi:HAD family hydrolase [Shewanella gelidii]|uniref:Phosphatase n=1 Tax=Shewanella gelidii TaxID=1642821 RepID=A0A917JK57_9GAMM|nr:HAD-IA family hydrolase [Shewanella gelidii]MCL1096795.1 HAD-IA family hydrolase [Shewanella gelidii]GGI70245.1 phosphatase [Shewanella gelidii]
MSELPVVHGVIFDLDGTLVTSNINFELIRKQIGCPLEVDILGYIKDLQPAQAAEKALQIIIQHELIDALQSRAIAGATVLLNYLQQNAYPTAIVTRNCLQASRLKTDRNQIQVQTLLTREDYPPKPAPDALNAISKQWSIAPENLMYVGDYLYDIQAANNAGMQSCFINHGTKISYEHQADLIISNLNELKLQLEKQRHLRTA